MSQKRPHATIEEKPKSAYQKSTEQARRAFTSYADDAAYDAAVFARTKPLLLGKSAVQREHRVSRALVTLLDQLMDTDQNEVLDAAIQTDTGAFGLWFNRQFGELSFSSQRRDALWEDGIWDLFVLACEHMALSKRVGMAIREVATAIQHVPEENSDGDCDSPIDLHGPFERLIAALGKDEYFTKTACSACGSMAHLADKCTEKKKTEK